MDRKKITKFSDCLPVISVTIIVLFFLIAILSMSMTGEDILNKLATSRLTLPQTFIAAYEYLPRIGEIFHRMVIRFFSYQVSFTSDLFFRLFDVALCLLAIFTTAALILGHRPRLELCDATIVLLTFICLTCFNSREIFMMRFSFIHNYLPIIILLSSTLYILLRQKAFSLRVIAGDLLIAIACGCSNEIVPIALLAIVGGMLGHLKIQKKHDHEREIRLVTVFIGLFIGLILMLGNGAILNRLNNAYGEAYDYVSYFSIFSTPLYTIRRILAHIVFNLRDLFIIIIILSVSIVVNICNKKQDFPEVQLVCLALSIIYVLGVSQIKILDDTGSRLLSPAYLAIVVGILNSIASYLDLLKRENEKTIAVINIGIVLLALLAIADISYLRIQQYGNYRNTFERIQTSDSSVVSIIQGVDNIQFHSLLFDYSSYPPFEEWTTNYLPIIIYDKQIDFAY